MTERFERWTTEAGNPVTVVLASDDPALSDEDRAQFTKTADDDNRQENAPGNPHTFYLHDPPLEESDADERPQPNWRFERWTTDEGNPITVALTEDVPDLRDEDRAQFTKMVDETNRKHNTPGAPHVLHCTGPSRDADETTEG